MITTESRQLQSLSPDATVVRSYIRDEWQSVPDILTRAVAYYGSLTVERAAAAYGELLAAGRVEQRQVGPLLAPAQARLAQTPARVAARAAVKAWNNTSKGRVLVAVTGHDPDDETSIDITYGHAFINHDDVAVILTESHRDLRLDRITVHTLHADLAAWIAPEPDGLDFPPPDCTRCDQALQHDGDVWTCLYCRAWWDSSGMEGHYPCVECQHAEATVTGADGQPRCTLCEARVRAGLAHATPPYECARCKTTVYGIGVEIDGPCRVRPSRRCPGCQHAADRDAYLASYRRAVPA